MSYFFSLILTQKRWTFALLLLFSTSFLSIQAQGCGFDATAGDGCPNTDYSNFGFNSNSNAATIEYDNFVATFHSTSVRNSNGNFTLWGEYMLDNGSTSLLSPQELNSTNYPALGSAKVLKVTGASRNMTFVQFVALTTDGLYAWGREDVLFSTDLTASSTFAKLPTIGTNTYGLPASLTPADVKMLTASSSDATDGGALMLTTCSGQVWVLAMNNLVRGNGTFAVAPTVASKKAWTQVLTAASTPLTNVIAARVKGNGGMALKSDGTIWTWGEKAFLGNNTAAANLSFATQMQSPDATKTIKMFAISGEGVLDKAYYVLMTDGNLYTLGSNGKKHLGDWTATTRNSWIQPRYTSSTGPVMNNIKWISVQQNDNMYVTVNVINTDAQLYSWGYNFDPQIPSGISATDRILATVAGGHTDMVIKECTSNFGYKGHRINGSMGNGSSVDANEASYTFATAAVSICGAGSSIASNVAVNVQNTTGDYCSSSTFQLTASPPGGTFSILSGNATVNTSDVITFSGSGNVQIQYISPPGCPTENGYYSLSVVDCCPVVSPISN